MLSLGLLVINQLDDYKVAVLYGIVPLVFVVILVMEGRILLGNRSLNTFLIFFAWACLGIFYTVNNDLTEDYLSILLGNCILWYSAYRIVIRTESIRGLLIILAISLTYNALQGYITPVEVVEKVGYGRATGLFANSNALGFMMWYGIVVVSALWVLWKNNWLMKAALVGIALLLLFVLLNSGSRKNAFAVVVYASILIYYLGRSGYRFGAVALTAVALVFYFVVEDQSNVVSDSALGQRFQSDNVERGAEFRLLLIEEGINFFLSHPLMGISLGSFTTYSAYGKMSHNDYVEVLSGTGLVGILLYLAVYYLFFKRNQQLLKNKETRNLGAVLQAFLAGFLLLGMGRPSLLDPLAILILGFFQSLSYRGDALIQAENKTS